MNFFKLNCLLSLISLSACGSGGSVENIPVTFASLSSEGLAITNRLFELDITPIANMPISGSSSFSGVGAYSASETDLERVIMNPDTVSKVDFNANFARSTLTGKAHDFRSADGGEVSGVLNITNGNITDNVFDADISGTLNNRGVPVDYSGDVIGAFGGNNAGFLAGNGSATGTSAGYQPQTITAVFAAEKN
jgi:hypothetical protein